jgi:hypothetical protein
MPVATIDMRKPQVIRHVNVLRVRLAGERVVAELAVTVNREGVHCVHVCAHLPPPNE